MCNPWGFYEDCRKSWKVVFILIKVVKNSYLFEGLFEVLGSVEMLLLDFYFYFGLDYVKKLGKLLLCFSGIN